MDCSLPGSSIHGIFQARALAWFAIAFSGWFTIFTENMFEYLLVPSLPDTLYCFNFYPKCSLWTFCLCFYFMPLIVSHCLQFFLVFFWTLGPTVPLLLCLSSPSLPSVELPLLLSETSWVSPPPSCRFPSPSRWLPLLLLIPFATFLTSPWSVNRKRFARAAHQPSSCQHTFLCFNRVAAISTFFFHQRLIIFILLCHFPLSPLQGSNISIWSHFPSISISLSLFLL